MPFHKAGAQLLRVQTQTRPDSATACGEPSELVAGAAPADWAIPRRDYVRIRGPSALVK